MKRHPGFRLPENETQGPAQIGAGPFTKRRFTGADIFQYASIPAVADGVTLPAEVDKIEADKTELRRFYFSVLFPACKVPRFVQDDTAGRLRRTVRGEEGKRLGL